MRRLLAASLACWLGLSSAPALANPAPRSFAGDARLLVDCNEAWDSIHAIVEGARRSIAVDYYILGGPRGLDLARRLVRRHREGVAVRVVLDPDLGILPALRKLTEPVLAVLREGGVPVRLYPRDVLARRNKFRFVEDHAKVVVADGNVAFVGSMNVGAELLTNHEIGVHLEGQAAHAIAGDVLRAFVLSPPLGPEQLRPWPASTLPERAGPATITHLPTGLAGRYARPAVVQAIEKATSSIRVMMFELEDWTVEAALIAAHRRGVDVRVLVDPNVVDHLSPIGWAPRGVFNLKVVSELVAAGVPVQWYKPREGEYALHAKAALIDGRLLVGSTNWNYFSFDWNNETMVAVENCAASERFVDVFEADWRARAERVLCPGPVQLVPQLWFYRGLAYMLN